MDGTILDQDRWIPPSAIRAIRGAREKENLCVVNTGRPLSHVEPSVIDIGFDGFICSCGQHILLNGASLLHRSFPPEACGRAVQLAKACRVDCMFESEDGIRVLMTYPMPPEFKAELSHFTARGFDVYQSPEEPGWHFDKFCFWLRSDSDNRTFAAFAEQYCTLIDRGGGMFECVLRGCSKETGVLAVMDVLKVSLEDCYAVGDSTNDLPMLSCVPHSIAMGAAPEVLRRAVEFVTLPLEQDGLAAALEHFELCRPSDGVFPVRCLR